MLINNIMPKQMENPLTYQKCYFSLIIILKSFDNEFIPQKSDSSPESLWEILKVYSSFFSPQVPKTSLL